MWPASLGRLNALLGRAPGLLVDNTPIYRTDFTSDEAWAALVQQLQTPSDEGFVPYLKWIEYPSLAGATIDRLLQLNGDASGFFFVVDAQTMQSEERPILVVDAYEQPGRSFRVVPSEMWAVENNLSIANMDWEEFADECDDDGVLRKPG